jgi:hypothetical protein
MKITEFLTENKQVLTETKTYQLWESAGFAIKEAALTKDQIQQLFQQIEQGATAGGGNRTMLGKGKDAATAVNKAWEDLKTKIQDSGPIQSVDKKYDEVVAKIEAGLGGPDNKVNQVIQRYRQFAKEHPIAQGFVYAALIAAAGISGAGLGGAAILGLLKMSDKLLQGEKFSSAAYAGAKTGVLAFAASKVGDYIKDKFATYNTENTYYVNGREVDKATYDATMKGIQSDLAEKGIDFEKGTFDKSAVDSVVKDQISDVPAGGGIKDPNFDALDKASLSKSMDTNPMMAQRAGVSNVVNPDSASSDLAQKIMSDPEIGARMSKAAVDSIANIDDQAAKAAWAAVQKQVDSGELTDHKRLSSALNKALNKSFDDFGINPTGPGSEFSKRAAREILAKAKDTESLLAALQGAKKESRMSTGKKLSEGQVYMLFNRVDLAQSYLAEAGLLDKVKGAASKGAEKLKTVGKNLTTKVTADKLSSAWQKAGSPTDSNELFNFLTQQGVNKQVIAPVYDTMKLPVPKDTAPEEEPAQQLQPGKDEPAVQAKAGSVELQTQPSQEEPAAAAPSAEKPAQSTKIDIVALAQEIKSVDPDITNDVKRMLDSSLAAKKKAAPKEQPAQQAQPQPAA